MIRFYFFLMALLLGFQFRAGAQTVIFTQLATGFNAPVDVIAPPDGSNRLFIVEKAGTVRIWNSGTVLPDSFLNIAALVNTSGERGLLSLAFHPGYAANRYFFVLYNNSAGDIVLARYRTQSANANAADAGSGVILKTIPHPTYDNHNGGRLLFGQDQLLYWSTGDGGSGGDPNNNAQNGNSLLGKMLRLRVDSFNTPPYYTIPSTNPFVGDISFSDEIWAFGLRNPWRWSFDRQTGDMWIADVGQGSWEEVNFVAASAVPAGGLDFGWRCREGAHTYNNNTGCSPNFTDPIFEYDHTLGKSITGGYVYRGTQYPALSGKYICADFVMPRLWLLTKTGSTVTSIAQTAGVPQSLTSFGENAAGELFAVNYGGTLYRLGLEPSSIPAQERSFFSVYPNPARSGHELSLRSRKPLERIELYHISGSRVYSEQALVSGTEYHFRLPAAVAPGTYLLVTSAAGGETGALPLTVQ